MAERTWIHAFTDGRDVSPTSASRPRRAAGRADRDGRRPLLRDGSRPALGAHGARARGDPVGEGQPADDLVAAVAESYERGVTDEFVEPIVLDGRPGSSRARTRDLLQLPTRPGSPALEKLLAAGVDLTTMTRYRDDLDVPGGVRRAGGAPRRSPRCSPGTALRQLHAAETEKYAHVTYFFNGGVEERVGRGETRILVPSPRDVPSYDHKPEMSAAEVARALLRGDRPRLRVRGRQLREPGHGRPHGLDPGGRAGGRDGRRVPRRRGGRGGTPPAASASSPPTTETPRRCSSRTASARTRRTRRTRCRSSSPRTNRLEAGASCPTSRPPCWRCSASTRPQMTGQSWSTAGNRALYSGDLALPQPDLGVLRKAQRGDERAFSLIVRAYELPVYNYVLRLVGDRRSPRT